MDAGIRLPIPLEVGAWADASPASAVLLLAVVALVGRVFLAWLPPGSTGGHAPREWPMTWAASHLVGITWFLAIRGLAPEVAWPYFAFGIPTIALLARILTSPAGLVPRHEPVPLRTSGAARAVIVAAVLATGAWSAHGGTSGASVLLAFTTSAAAILAHEALAIARVEPWLRAVTLVAICAGIALLPHGERSPEAYSAIGACGIAAGTVGWIRRGDRRALAIASIGIAFILLSGAGTEAGGVALAVPIVVVLGTARPSRLRAFAWLSGSVFASAVAWRLGGHESPMKSVARTPLGVGVDWTLAALVVSALGATYLLRIRRGTPAWNPSGAPESREARVLGIAAVATIAISHTLSCRVSDYLGSSDYPANSPAAVSSWVLLAVAVAIPLARTLDRARTT